MIFQWRCLGETNSLGFKQRYNLALVTLAYGNFILQGHDLIERSVL